MNKSSFEEEIEKHGFFLYTNVGDSMLPLIREKRDAIIIVKKPEGRLKRLDVPLYRRDNGKYVLHRVLRVRRNDYVICGDNRWKREYGIEDRHIVGVLGSVVRNGRTVRVTDPAYRLYSHLWCDFFFIRAGILFIRSLPNIIRRKLSK